METGHVLMLFREYMGTGLIIIWFLIALLYLFLQEKQKKIRVLFVYVPIILLGLFFCPGISGLIMKAVGDDIYYRILWLLPVTMVLAYTGVSLLGRLAGRWKLPCAVAMAVVFMMSGSLIYRNVYFSRAENLYHVPDSVVHICDAIEIPGREVTAVFPLELIQYVRQYSPVVCMPYGREVLVETWNEWSGWNALCDAMEAEEVTASELGTLAREQNCNYIVVREQKKILGRLQDAGYEEFFRTDGYIVYRDQYFDPGM